MGDTRNLVRGLTQTMVTVVDAGLGGHHGLLGDLGACMAPIDDGKFDEARAAVKAAEKEWRTTTVSDPEIVRAETLISFMDSPLDD